EDAIRAELGDPRIRVAQIGPAGENLVRFACIANELNEVAGRSGMGAVMGSKRLKAIAVRGKVPVKIADQPGLLAMAKWVSGTMDEKHRAFHEFGTGAAMQGKRRSGGADYGSLAAHGVKCGLDDLIAICKSCEMCNSLAMGTVSLGATLAWAMECFVKGILTLEDTGGVPLRFHGADGGIKVVEM